MVSMEDSTLKQISKKLDEINTKVSALLVKEEKPTLEEKRAIKAGEKEFKEGKFKSWRTVKAQMK